MRSTSNMLSPMLSISSFRDTFAVPLEIFMAWGQPSSIETWQDGNATMVQVSDLGRLRRLAKRVAGRRISKVISLSELNYTSGFAMYSDPTLAVPDGEYLPANYHPMHQLIDVGTTEAPTISSRLAALNSSTWRDVEGYHEHRLMADQDTEAHAVSEMLVTALKEGGNPESILELGCGSGRNLWHFAQAFPSARISGIDINPSGVNSREMPPNVSIEQADVLNLNWDQMESFDVVFTSGFLMHINHGAIQTLMRQINRNARTHFHYELHGPSNSWDIHRYPRCYRTLMDALGLEVRDYTIYASHPIYSYGLSRPFAHALLAAEGSRSV